MKKLFLLLLLLIPSMAQAAMENAKLSLSVNIIPDAANQSVGHVPGSNNLDDSAYQFQLSFTWSKEDHVFAKSVREFIAVRAFKFIENYNEEGAEGASALEGVAVFYGQRYMLTSERYEGLGIGWYAGATIGTDRYVEQGFNTIPIEEDLFAPLAVAEAFYRFSRGSAFLELSAVMAINKDTTGVTFVPAVLGGVQF